MANNAKVTIQINTLDEAIHWENHAVLTLNKIKQNPVEGQADLQSSLVRTWTDVHRQARKAVGQFIKQEEAA
ncbi:hypothetical protein [Vibrio fluvialis]|uniref:hypothetical protein n=1 Tax=Vibrio fluvialis TaxID=676 RepID=UPI001EEB663E|nr:hypothetical protein [Vibrio fluvialis]MCG6362190.1 hypothetical protein [Vibrio fluvialis]